jgi:hypothetical protein
MEKVVYCKVKSETFDFIERMRKKTGIGKWVIVGSLVDYIVKNLPEDEIKKIVIETMLTREERKDGKPDLSIFEGKEKPKIKF